MTAPAKACKRCEQEKPLEEFRRHGGSEDGHIHVCKTCAGTPTRPASVLSPDELVRLRADVGLDPDGNPLPGHHTWGWPR